MLGGKEDEAIKNNISRRRSGWVTSCPAVAKPERKRSDREKKRVVEGLAIGADYVLISEEGQCDAQ
jgi:hypothetical protein